MPCVIKLYFPVVATLSQYIVVQQNVQKLWGLGQAHLAHIQGHFSRFLGYSTFPSIFGSKFPSCTLHKKSYGTNPKAGQKSVCLAVLQTNDPLIVLLRGRWSEVQPSKLIFDLPWDWCHSFSCVVCRMEILTQILRGRLNIPGNVRNGPECGPGEPGQDPKVFARFAGPQCTEKE